MADRILANTDTYQQIARRLNVLAQELGDAASSLSRVNTDREAGGRVHVGLGGRLRSTGASMPDGQIASVVRNMRSIIYSLREYTGDFADNVRKVASLIENVEQELTRLEPGTGEDAVYSKGSKIGEAVKRVVETVNEFVQVFTDEDGKQGMIIDGINIAELIDGDLSQWIIGPMNPLPGIGLLIGPGSNAFDALSPVVNLSDFQGGEKYPLGVDPNGLNPFNGLNVDFFSEYSLTDYLDGSVADDMKGRLHDATSVSAEVSGSASIFSWEGSVSNDHGSAEAHMDFLKVEGEAGASAHVFDEDGNFRPGAEAHIGGSATIFEAGASGEYELIDNVKIHGSAKVTAGEVAAEAEVNVGFDEDGDFNLNAGASLEAIAVEASADVGVEIAGVDVKGEVGVNVGIGAHADIGYEDGVLKVDVGASLGLGVDGSFEVDVGGAIDNVKDFVNEKIDNFMGASESFFEGIFNL